MSPRRRLALLALALGLGASACVAPGTTAEEETQAEGLQAPTFAPLDEPTTDAPTTAAGSDPSTPGPTSTDTPPSPAATASPTAAASPAAEASPGPTASATPATLRGQIDDGTGDLQGLESGRAPDHADLRRVVLEQGPSTGRITITFAGPAPEATEGDHVLNVATYHDVTGDGRVDYEIWASLTSDGWGTAWYDLREGTARFAADDDVDVAVVDGDVVLTFPAGHLDHARSGQWLASSEWGTSMTISSGTSATDDAPDDRSGRPWPS